MKILVIEDDAETVRNVDRALQEALHDAASRADGRDGLKAALDEQIQSGRHLESIRSV